MEPFDYVIARDWNPCVPGQLATYRIYGTEIQHGSMPSAVDLLAYVKSQLPHEDWHVYRISFLKLDIQ